MRQAVAIAEPGEAGVKLSRGFARLATGLAVVWFVFWTVAYVARPHLSENMPFPGPPPSLTEFAVLTPLFLAAGILGVRWIIAGFRSN